MANYDYDYRGLNNDRVEWSRRNPDTGDWERCNRNDEGAVEDRYCGCCGCLITGYRCTCADSKW